MLRKPDFNGFYKIEYFKVNKHRRKLKKWVQKWHKSGQKIFKKTRGFKLFFRL